MRGFTREGGTSVRAPRSGTSVRERLARTIERLKERIHAAPPDLDAMLRQLREIVTPRRRWMQWISVGIGDEVRLVTVGEVCYFRPDNKYTAVVTPDDEYLIDKTVAELSDRLDPELFWRIHRSVLVNVNTVRSAHRDFRGRLTLRLKRRSETLPVSAAHAHLFKQS